LKRAFALGVLGGLLLWFAIGYLFDHLCFMQSALVGAC
jgi:hypothetical protein